MPVRLEREQHWAIRESAAVVLRMMEIPLRKYRGGSKDWLPKDEAEHFMQCPVCGVWIDTRDLAQILGHEGPLPHPGQNHLQ
jgi:hypothetical protein